jgi:hypothetical protein
MSQSHGNLAIGDFLRVLAIQTGDLVRRMDGYDQASRWVDELVVDL